MQPAYKKLRVSQNVQVLNNIYMLSVEGTFDVKPGQFFMLRSWGMMPLLSRPISVHDVRDGIVDFLYMVRGNGTEILKNLKNGDYIEVLGPLGNGFPKVPKGGRAAIVAGGIGIAPMLYAAKKMECAGVDLYAGFRDEVFAAEKFKQYVDNIYIATDTGKWGHEGFVTDIFSPEDYSIVLCCGPEVMMKKITKSCLKHDTPVYVSLEKHMACGMGACLVCTCKTSSGNKRACKDGPVFDGRDVIFDD